MLAPRLAPRKVRLSGVVDGLVQAGHAGPSRVIVLPLPGGFLHDEPAHAVKAIMSALEPVTSGA